LFVLAAGRQCELNEEQYEGRDEELLFTHHAVDLGCG
jgi:hypothetical protein